MRVCWFCLGTGFWKCNEVFDRGEVILGNLLCTIDVMFTLCTSFLLDGVGYKGLCTTETSPNVCAGFFFWWILYNWLCTTEIRISFCAGMFFGCLEYSMLCTTDPNLNLCTGLFFWYNRSAGLIAMHYSNDWFICVMAIWFSLDFV